MDSIPIEKQEKILQFLKDGYNARLVNPPSGEMVEVITDKLNVYTCRFESFLGNKIWEYDGHDLKEYEEEVLHWKYF